MTGSNCSIVGCSTSRNANKTLEVPIPIMRIPSGKKYGEEEWRKQMLNIITKDRVIDERFQKMIDKNDVFVCAKHFKEEELYHCKSFIFFSHTYYCILPMCFYLADSNQCTVISAKQQNKSPKLFTLYIFVSLLNRKYLKMLISWHIFSISSSRFLCNLR